MFYTIGSLTESAYRANAAEEATFKWLLQTLTECCGYSCSFLLELNINEIELWWAPDLNSKGILGAWSIMHPKCIYMGVNRISVPKQLIERCEARHIDAETVMHFSGLLETNLVVAMIHELTHMFQFRTCPPLFVINYLITRLIDKIPYVNRIGVEYDARQNSEDPELEEFARKLSSADDAYMNLQLHGKEENLVDGTHKFINTHGVLMGNYAIEMFNNLNSSKLS